MFNKQQENGLIIQQKDKARLVKAEKIMYRYERTFSTKGMIYSWFF